MSTEKINDTIWDRTSDIQICSTDELKSTYKFSSENRKLRNCVDGEVLLIWYFEDYVEGGRGTVDCIQLIPRV
jgi:hypothetical protein